jgi:hypothetical protein
MAAGERRANVGLVAAAVRLQDVVVKCWLRLNRLLQPRLQMLRLEFAPSGEVVWRRELCLRVLVGR